MERERSATPDLLRIVRRRWLTIVVAALLAAAAAFGFSQLQQKTYSATASLVFGEQTDLLSGQSSSGSNADPERVAATTVELVAGRAVIDRTAEAVKRSPDYVATAVDVKAKGISNVVTVTAFASSPEFAAKLANVYANQYIDLRTESDQKDLEGAQKAIERRLRALTPEQQQTGVGRLLRERLNELEVQGPLQAGSVRVAEKAFEPDKPSSPNIALNTALGGLLGLLLGLGLATLRERVDSRLVEPEEQSDAYGLPILAALPAGRALENSREAFRGLQARLQHFHFGREIRCVLVTSSSPGEGTSTVAWQLASAAAVARDRRVLLIEADLRRPELAVKRGLAADPGLAQVVSGDRSLAESVQKPGSSNGSSVDSVPDVLTAGVPVARKSNDGAVAFDLLDTDAMADLLREADESYDYVVIDTPALGEVADAIPLVSQVDGVLVVSRRGKVTRSAAESLRDLLRGLGAPVLGVVLVGAKPGTDATMVDPRTARRSAAGAQSGRRPASRSGS
jgi:Mrp family chromosome partitioning ATPase